MRIAQSVLYVLDGPKSSPGGCEIFPHRSIPVLRPTQYNGYQVSFHGFKAAGDKNYPPTHNWPRVYEFILGFMANFIFTFTILLKQTTLGHGILWIFVLVLVHRTRI